MGTKSTTKQRHPRHVTRPSAVFGMARVGRGLFPVRLDYRGHDLYACRSTGDVLVYRGTRLVATCTTLDSAFTFVLSSVTR